MVSIEWKNMEWAFWRDGIAIEREDRKKKNEVGSIGVDESWLRH